MIFRAVSTTRPGTGVNAAKKVTMETRLRGRAEFARAHSDRLQTGGGEKYLNPNGCTISKCKPVFQEINHDLDLQFCNRL